MKAIINCFILFCFLALPNCIRENKVHIRSKRLNNHETIIKDTLSYVDSLKNIYLNSKYLDIKIATYLYVNNDTSPLSLLDTYMDFYSDSIWYFRLYDSLFFLDPNKPYIIKKLKNNLQTFISEEREYVLDQYNKFGETESPDFSFLVSVCDTTLIPIILRVLDDKNLSEKHTITMIRYLNKCFPSLMNDSLRLIIERAEHVKKRSP